MKRFIVFSLLVASIAALPHFFSKTLQTDLQAKDSKAINEQIVNALEQLRHNLRDDDDGLDPFYLPYASESYALPVPVLFNAYGYVEELLVTGLSQYEIINIDYSLIGSTLEFDVFFPSLDVQFGSGGGHVVVFGDKYEAVANGRLVIKDLRVAGDTNISILGGIRLSALRLECSVGAIESHLTANILGYDVSNVLNYFIENTVVRKFDELNEPINELLSHYLIDIINDVLADL